MVELMTPGSTGEVNVLLSPEGFVSPEQQAMLPHSFLGKVGLGFRAQALGWEAAHAPPGSPPAS